MTDISTTGVFVCLAAQALFGRFLTRGSIAARAVPLLCVFPAAFFAFKDIEVAVASWLDSTVMIIAVLILGIDALLNLAGNGEAVGRGR